MHFSFKKITFTLFSTAFLLSASAGIATAGGKGGPLLCSGGYFVYAGSSICATYVAIHLPGGGADLATLPVCDRLTRARVNSMALTMCRPVGDPKRCDKVIFYRGIKEGNAFDVGSVRITCPAAAR